MSKSRTNERSQDYLNSGFAETETKLVTDKFNHLISRLYMYMYVSNSLYSVFCHLVATRQGHRLLQGWRCPTQYILNTPHTPAATSCKHSPSVATSLLPKRRYRHTASSTALLKPSLTFLTLSRFTHIDATDQLLHHAPLP